MHFWTWEPPQEVEMEGELPVRTLLLVLRLLLRWLGMEQLALPLVHVGDHHLGIFHHPLQYRIVPGKVSIEFEDCFERSLGTYPSRWYCIIRLEMKLLNNTLVSRGNLESLAIVQLTSTQTI